jgi:pilus assembly protein CpaF
MTTLQNNPIPKSNGNGDNGHSHDFSQLKAKVHKRLLESMNLAEARHMSPQRLQAECARRASALLGEQRCPLTAPEKKQLLREVIDEIFGLGPLEEFLRDPTVTDILVNGHDQVYVEKFGRMELTEIEFRDTEHLMLVIHRIASNVGRRIDESSPMLDARLDDGSRVNAIIPPLALDGPMMSVRRFGATPIDMSRLIQFTTLTDEMGAFLKACVKVRMNTLISGGTGAGKTTLLNSMSRYIPDHERVVTIEDAAELQLQREHVVRLETRPPNVESKGEVTQRDLLRNALRMRPDRIVIGEVRGGEALDMLQAMNTGHEGSMTTVHANNPRDATRRIENMVSMAGLNFPIHVIRQQMTSALNLVVHIARLTGGERKVTNISEITGMEGDQFSLQDIFRYRQTGIDRQGRAKGVFQVCGVRPQLLTRMEAEGIELPQEMFQRRNVRTRTPWALLS